MTSDTALETGNSALQQPTGSLESTSETINYGLGALGIVRWVQFGFFLLGIIIFWLLDRVITSAWDIFAEPKAPVISFASAVVAVVTVVVLYKVATVREAAFNIASELSKVVWPTKQETWSSTLIVIITSVVAAVILGTLDAFSSAMTDLIPAFFEYVGVWWSKLFR